MRQFWLQRNVYLLVTIIVLLVGIIGVLTLTGSGAAIAASVTASGLVGLFYLYSQFVEGESRVRSRIFDDAGLRNVWPTRRIDYRSAMTSAKHTVDVMGYSLRSFIDDHSAAIRAKDGTRFTCRILVVDPASPASAAQERLEGLAPGTFASSIEHLRSRLEDTPSVTIHTVSHALPTMLFRIDDTMYVGPYLSHEASAATVTLELSASGWMFDEYAAEFDALWAPPA